MEDGGLKIDLSFRDEDPDAVEAVLRELGAGGLQRVDQGGMTGIEILFVGAVAASTLANLVIRLSRLWKCGVSLDARGPRIVSEKDCNLPAGSVLVIAPNGTRSTLHEPSEVTIQEHLQRKA